MGSGDLFPEEAGGGLLGVGPRFPLVKDTGGGKGGADVLKAARMRL